MADNTSPHTFDHINGFNEAIPDVDASNHDSGDEVNVRKSGHLVHGNNVDGNESISRPSTPMIDEDSEPVEETPTAKSLLSRTFIPATGTRRDSIPPKILQISRPESVDHDNGFSFEPMHPSRRLRKSLRVTPRDVSTGDLVKPSTDNCQENAANHQTHLGVQDIQGASTRSEGANEITSRQSMSCHRADPQKDQTAAPQARSPRDQYTPSGDQQTAALEIMGVELKRPDSNINICHVEPSELNACNEVVHETPKLGQHTSPTDLRGPAPKRSIPSISEINKTPKFRISKPPQKQRHRGDQSPWDRSGAPVPMPQPSEEDLLYLLMARAREHENTKNNLIQLEHEYRNLHRDNERLQLERDEAASLRLAAAERQDSLSKRLHEFKEKYYKLKKWAFEANEDCMTLQTQSYAMKNSVEELVQERASLKSYMSNLRQTQNQSISQMTSVTSAVADIKKLTEKHLTNAHRNEILLKVSSDLVRREQRRCEKLEGHISQLERHRRTQDSQTRQGQDRLAESLQDIARQVTLLSDGQECAISDSSQVLDSMRKVETSLNKGLASRCDMHKLQESVTELFDLVKSHSELLPAALQSSFQSLKQTIEFEASRIFAESDNNNSVTIRELKEHAIQAETTLTKLHDQVLSSKEGIRTLTVAHTKSRENDLSQLNALRKELNQANSDVAACKNQRDSDAERIKTLANQLEDAKARELCSRQEAEKAKDNLGAMKQNSTDARKQCDALEQKLKDEEETITMLRNEVAHFKSLQAESETKAMASKDGLAQAWLKNEAMQAELDQTVKDLRGMQFQVENVLQMRQQLEAANITITKLRIEADVAATHASKQAQATAKLEQEIQDLRMQNGALTEQSMVQEKLKCEIEDLRKEVQSKHEIQEKLTGKYVEAEELRMAVSEAQKKLATLDEVQKSNEGLKASKNVLETELEAARVENRQNSGLQDIINSREENIRDLKNQLSTTATMQAELLKLKEDNRGKEQQIGDLEKKIMRLEPKTLDKKLDEPLPTAHPVHPPRRVADRSGQTSGVKIVHQAISLTFDETTDPIQATGLIDEASLIASEAASEEMQSTGSVVAETQPEIQETFQETQPNLNTQLDMLDAMEPIDLEASSSLSDPDDDLGGELDNFETHNIESNHGRAGPQTPLQGHRTDANLVGEGCPSMHRRPPSSSYGSADPMLLDLASQPEHLSGVRAVSIGSKISDPQPVGNSQLMGLSKKGPSPRRLRSSQQLSLSKMRSSRGQSDPNSSSPMTRESHLPNSAAKRRHEQKEDSATPTQPSKRLKRTPANLEVKSSQHPGIGFQSGKQSPKRTVLTLYKTSSIIGTNAPAPSKSQRGSKAARKGSRQDKYSARFSSDA